MSIVQERERVIATTVELESVADVVVGGSVLGTMWCAKSACVVCRCVHGYSITSV